MKHTCGAFLDDCPGGYHHPTRDQAAVNAAHRAAVARARRSGFAAQPLPGWLFTLLDPAAVLPVVDERRAA